MMQARNESAWGYAISLVRYSGLEPTREFLDLVEKEKRGEIKEFLDKKYKKPIA